MAFDAEARSIPREGSTEHRELALRDPTGQVRHGRDALEVAQLAALE
jgi:hypothetical protein